MGAIWPERVGAKAVLRSVPTQETPVRRNVIMQQKLRFVGVISYLSYGQYKTIFIEAVDQALERAWPLRVGN